MPTERDEDKNENVLGSVALSNAWYADSEGDVDTNGQANVVTVQDSGHIALLL